MTITAGLTMTAGSFGGGPGTITLGGNSQWTGGTLTPGGLMQNTGTLTIPGATRVVVQGGTFSNAGTIAETGSGGRVLDGGTLNNTGTIIQSDSGNLVINLSTTLNNQTSGLIDLQSDAGIHEGTGGGFFPPLNNMGTLRESAGTGISTVTTVFNNQTGTIDVRRGTLALAAHGGDSTAGNFTAAAGAVLDLTGGTNSNHFQGTYTGSGAGTVLLASGMLIVGQAGGGGHDATFNFAPGLFQWTGGTLQLNDNGGTPGLTNAGTIGLAGAAAKTFTSGTLNNIGTITETGSGNLVLNNSTTLNNQATGLIDLQSDAGIRAGGGSGFFPPLNNAGTVRKSAGSGTSTITTAFVNQGSTAIVDVRGGTVSLAGGGTSSGGTFTVAAGAVLGLTGGMSINFNGTYTGSGAGTVLLGGGQLNASTITFNFPAGLFQWTGGTIQGSLVNSGTLTLGGTATKVFAGTLTNTGTLIANGSGGLVLNFSTGLTNQSAGVIDLQSDAGIILGGGGGFSPFLTNAGTMQKSGGTATSTIDNGISFSNSMGTVVAPSGTLAINQETDVSGSTLAGGTWEVFDGAALKLNGGANLTTDNATVILDGPHPVFTNLTNLNTLGATGSLTIQDGGAFTTAGTSFTNQGSLTIDATSSFTVSANLANFDPTSGTLTAGTYVVAGTLQFPGANIVTLAANLVLDGSGGLGQILDQNGTNGLANLADIGAAGQLTLQHGYVLTISGDLSNFGYLLIDSTSVLNVSGNYTQDGGATLEIQLDGIAGTSGQLNVAGTATLDGALTLTPVNGYVPSTGDSFAVLTYGARSGDFANPPAGFNESFDDVNGVLTVVAQ